MTPQQIQKRINELKAELAMLENIPDFRSQERYEEMAREIHKLISIVIERI